MDMSVIAERLGLCDVTFESSVLGIGEVCKAIICLEIAASKYKERFLAALPPFRRVSTSMSDLCFDVFGIAKEKKDTNSIKGNRDLLDVLPSKRKHEDGSDSSDGSTDDNEDELDKQAYMSGSPLFFALTSRPNLIQTRPSPGDKLS